MKPVSDDKSCACDDCKACCKIIPEIPRPEELVKQAEFLKMSLKEYLEKFCIKGWRENALGDGEYIVFAYPARQGFNNMTETWLYPLVGGNCIFLTEEELCKIHPVRPFECREAFGCKPSSLLNKFRNEALRVWQEAWEKDYLPKEIKEFLVLEVISLAT